MYFGQIKFDNIANFKGHYETTGPEIWNQTEGKVDAFICASGTGGTIAGVGKALKEKNKNIKIVLSDPKGSALYNHIKHGELKIEGKSITEGIGSSRVTKNFEQAPIDDAYSINDHDALTVLFELLEKEGLSLGTSHRYQCRWCYKISQRFRSQPYHCNNFCVINLIYIVARCLIRNF